ncbi:hypothetical protein NC652_011990 [Populus alba x Populus x berolinensis]|nr:hypothetical protein NC652_011990 [Populus alba x Populus x berolinensis]
MLDSLDIEMETPKMQCSSPPRFHWRDPSVLILSQVLSGCSPVLQKTDSKGNMYAVFSRRVSIIFRLVSRIQIRSLFLFLSNLENTTDSNSDFCICCKPSRYFYYQSVKETGDLDADRAIKLREEQKKQREKERD